jgi:hypothetical protein
LVQIVVGPKSATKTFTLSKRILAHASPFFEKAFNGNFAEGVSGVMEMPETTIKAFEHAIAYIISFENRFVKFDSTKFASESDFINIMIELSALSQILIMPTLDQWATTNLRALLDTNSSSLTIKHIAFAFELLCDKSEVRGAIIRTTLAHFSQKSWDVSTRNILVDWKFGGALVEVPGFMAAFFHASKDVNMGRIRL